jgi:hypothetical protein
MPDGVREPVARADDERLEGVRRVQPGPGDGTWRNGTATRRLLDGRAADREVTRGLAHTGHRNALSYISMPARWPGAQRGLAICVPANSAFRAARCAYSTHCLAAPRDRGATPRRVVLASVNPGGAADRDVTLGVPIVTCGTASCWSAPARAAWPGPVFAATDVARSRLQWPGSLFSAPSVASDLQHGKSEHENQQPGRF